VNAPAPPGAAGPGPGPLALAARFVRFGVVGASGVVVDMSVLYLMHDPRGLAQPLVASKVVAAQLAIVNNFIWNERWTFADRVRDTTWRDHLVRFLRFELICLVGLGLNVLILQFCARTLGLHYLIANAVAIGAVTIWNFALNLRWNWAPRPGGA